ncbi:hypothetical protein L9F63_007542, partial [Diploptera punctata]
SSVAFGEKSHQLSCNLPHSTKTCLIYFPRAPCHCGSNCGANGERIQLASQGQVAVPSPCNTP